MTACWDSVVQFHSLQVPPTRTCPSHRRVTLPNVDVTSLKCLLEVLMLPWGCLLKVKTPGLHFPGLYLTHLWGCLLKVNTPGLTWLVPYTHLWGCVCYTALRMYFEGKYTRTGLTWLVCYTPVRVPFEGKCSRTALTWLVPYTPMRMHFERKYTWIELM